METWNVEEVEIIIRTSSLKTLKVFGSIRSVSSDSGS